MIHRGLDRSTPRRLDTGSSRRSGAPFLTCAGVLSTMRRGWSRTWPRLAPMLPPPLCARAKLAHFSRDLVEIRVGDGLHRCGRIHRRHLDRTVLLLHHDVAGQHGAHLVLELERAMGERWIASLEDLVWTEVDAQLLRQRGADVDLGEDTEALVGESLRHRRDRLRGECSLQGPGSEDPGPWRRNSSTRRCAG